MPKCFTFHFQKMLGFFSTKNAFAAVRQIQLIYNSKELTVKAKIKSHFRKKKTWTQSCKHRVYKELYINLNEEFYIDTQKHSTKNYSLRPEKTINWV